MKPILILFFLQKIYSSAKTACNIPGVTFSAEIPAAQKKKSAFLLHAPLFILIVFISTLSAQATTYYSAVNGTPSALANWWTATNGTGTHPANFTTAGDVFEIQSGNTMTTTANWTVTGTVQIDNGGVLAVTSTGTTMNFGALTINSGGLVTENRNLTVTGATNISGTINFASTSSTARTMTFTGNVTLNIGAVWNEPATGNGANNTYNFAGNFTNNATSFNALGTGVHTFSGAGKSISGSTITSIGSITVTGSPINSGTLTARTTLAGAGNLTNGNGTTGTLNLGGAASITTLTATAAGNLVNYTGGAQTAKVTTYNNLTLSGSLAKTFATTPTVNGILSMEGTATVVVTTGVVTYGANARLQYNTATSRTTSSAEWLTTFAASGGVIIANTGIIIMNEAKIFNASIPLTINSGATLDTKAANSFTLTLGGNFVNNGGTFTAYASPIVITNTMASQSIAGFTTTGTVSLNKSAGTATFLGNVNGGPLTMNGSGTGTLNLGAGLIHTFTGDVNFLGGTLNGGSSTLNENNLSSTAFNGNTSLFIAGNSTVNFGGTSQSIAGTGTPTFNNLTVSNTSTKTFTNVPVVNGVFTIAGTATVSAAPTYGSASTLQYNTATSRTSGVEWITPFVASGGVIIANTGTITLNAAKVFNSTAPLTIHSGAAFAMSTFLLTLNGDLINNSAIATSGSGGVTIAGTATQSIGSFTTTGLVSMTKTGGTATLTGNVNGAGLTINGSGGTLNLGTALTHTFTSDITLTAGTLNGGSSMLNESNASATAWNGTGSVFTANAGTVNFGASGNQTIAASSSFFDLILSGSGNKTFSNATAISANLSISGTAKADLRTLTHSSNSLTLSGTLQAGGSWGSTGSGAANKNDTYFLSTASGIINVSCTAPAAPTSSGNDVICDGQTIPVLSVTVANPGTETADWYNQASGGTKLATGSTTYTPAGAGTFYAETRVMAGGCLSASRTGVTLTVNPNPLLLSLTGSAICTSPGNNGTITSTTSQSGVNYQLYNISNIAQGSVKAGTGAGLSWTGLSAANGYYVKETNATTNCYSSSGTVNITTNADPVALALTGSTICTSPGGNGTISSTTSVTGINYQLYNGSNAPVQSAQSGTGAGLLWSGLPAGTGYYVISTNATTSCVSSNSNTVDVASTANPAALGLTGSTICASPDGNGTIASASSQTGVNYQLFDNGDLEVGTPIPGTGSGLTWSGLSSGTGYYAVGTNATTFCDSDNSNAVNVSTTPIPTITSSATTTSVCFNLSSQNSTLAYSATTNTPINYTITWNTAAHTAGLVDLGTTSLPASPVTVPVAASVAGGTYTGSIKVTNANGCESLGNAFTLAINTAPAAPAGSATQIFCSGATVSNLSATGTSITWYDAASGGSPLSGSLALVNGTHYYASQTVSGCISSSRLAVTAIVVATGSWIGATSTNWFTTTNWCGGALPLVGTNVTIAAGLTNYPSIGTTGAVCNNITIESGASLTITGTNTLTVSGSWTNSGTFTANSSTVDFNGTGNIGASNFNNITFSTAGTKTATGALTIAGNVSITASTFIGGSFTHSVGGNWTKSGTFTETGSTIDFNGSGTGIIGAGNFNNITFSGAGTKTAAGALSIAGNVSITGNFTAGSYTHTVGGSWTKSGSFTAAGSTIDFNGSGGGNIGVCNFNNITFSGAGTKTATGALTATGNITITNNFSAGNYIHTIQGNWSNNGTFIANSSTVSFIGTSSTISGSSSPMFNNLTINQTTGATLGIETSVAGNLTLTAGKIDIGTYNLSVTSSGSIIGGSATSYIKTSSTGRLKQTVAGFGSVTKSYPVGNSAYNPMTVKYNNSAVSENFSIRVDDEAVPNANSSKTISRKWYLIEDAAGTSDLTLAATYNSGEEGTGFNNSSSPQIGYFDGTSWAYRPITSGSGTTTFTAAGSAPDFTNTTGYFVLGSDDAFNATKLAVININPANPSLGVANTTVTVQSQNTASVPTMVATATGFGLTCTNTTMSTAPTGSIGQYNYQTSVTSIAFTESTFNTGNSTYDHDATVTATRISGETLSSGTSVTFDVFLGAIYEPVATENWDATNGWKVSTDGGATFGTPFTLSSNTFEETDVIRIPADITLTANVTASFYSMLVYGTLDIASGALTLNHSSSSDYNIHVQGTLKHTGGTLTNNNGSFPTELIEIHGGTYWHNMNGGSIPACTFYTLNSTLSTCEVSGITSTALTGGLDQTFENFTWDNASQAVTQTLTADMTVNGALTLTAGKITTGSYHVIVGLAGTASNSGAGWINGNLRRYVANTVTTGDFPVGDANYYAPFSIVVNSGTPSGNGYLDVSTQAAQPPAASGLSQTKYINRKWTVSNNGVTGITTYNPSCTFADGDKVGSPATENLKLRKLTASNWYTTNGAATGNTITATSLSTAGLYAASDFYAGEDDCNPTYAVWLGGISTDWNTATNWCSGAVPLATTDVIIPSSPARQPIIGSAGGTCKAITIQSSASLSISGAFTLDIKGNWVNNGAFTAGTGTVSFTGTTAQTITGATTFDNLTINNTAGVTAANDLSVNEILTLTSVNPDATHGTLDMGTFTLSMPSASASVAGTGDVTGIVKRTHAFTPNVQYQFGSQYTSLNFLGLGTQPAEISCRIVLGEALPDKSNAVLRYYSFAQPGTTPTDKVVLNLRYLDSELNSNDETKLAIWDRHNSGTVEDHGRTNYSVSDNWVGLSGLTIIYIARTALDNRRFGLANYASTKKTWTGGDYLVNDSWSNDNNWAPPGKPISTDDILIPVVSTAYPVLTENVEIRTLEISAPGASTPSLYAGTYNLTINGYNSAWLNNGTFSPGTGTVNFTHGNLNEIVTASGSGTNQFHNVNIAANTFIKPGTGFYMKINGWVLAQLTSIVDLSAYGTTVEYNGTSQTIVNPSHSGYKGYYNIIFSGAGTSTLYDGTLDIYGDFTTNGTLGLSNSTVSFIGTSAQTINVSASPGFNNLTINNPAGVTAATDITVNGILYLQSDNPSLVAGALVMNSGKILNMGAISTTTGLGDVTGIVKRTHSFDLNTEYSFGNQNTVIIFPDVVGQTLPTSSTIKITLGSPPSWTPPITTNPINRVLDIAQTGGSLTKAILRSHFRSDELPAGTNPNTLSFWINKLIVPPSTYYTYEKGKSNISTAAGYSYIAVQDVDLAVIPSDLTDFHVAIAPTATTVLTWNGSQSTDWTNTANWTPNNDPTANAVIIPDANTTLHSPGLPVGASCKSVTIESYGVLHAASGATLSLTGNLSVWHTATNGLFNAGNSTVTISNTSGTSAISGNTNFYNVTIASGASLMPAADSYTSIAGDLVIVGTGVLDANANTNTIDFNGTGAQTVPASGYDNLIISGARTTNSVTLAPSGTIGITGTLTLSATFSSGSYISTSSTVSFDGTSGSQNIPKPFTFNNLTVNNNNGVSLSGDATVTGTLTFTSGKITTGANRLIVGTNSSCSAGTVTGAGVGKYVYGNLSRYVPNAAAPTVGYDIGDATNYTPVSVVFTGTATNCGYLNASTVAYQPPVGSGLSQTKYINRKWTLTNTGVDGFTSYSPSFTFVPMDEIGSPNTSALVIRKYNGAAWSATTTGTQGSLSTEATGLTEFSDFAIGEDECTANKLWFGGTSTEWNTGSNWCSGAVPTLSDNVTIQSGTLFQPHIGSSGSGSCKDITLQPGTTLTMDGSYVLNVAGNWTNNGSFTQSTGTVNFGGTGAQTINGATTFSTLKINNAAGVTLGAAATVTTLTIGDVTSSSVFNDGGYQVTSTGTLTLASGTFTIGSGSAGTAFPGFTTTTIAAGTTVDYGSSSEQTIAAVNYGNLTNTGNGQRLLASSGTIGISGTFTPGSGSYTVTGSTVDFNGTATQTINGMEYNNLTISGSGNNVKTAGSNITVNGILNLSSANASTTKGALNMGLAPDIEYILYMGAIATTTGTGDVSGYVNRSSFALNTDYTFGNQFTLMNFTVGPLPNSVTLELYLTASDIAWKPDAIHRYYDVVRSGGSPATRLRFNVHYLDAELNGATEDNLDLFDYHITSGTVHDHGRTDENTIQNWVGFGNVGLAFLGTGTSDDHFWTLGTSTTNNECTWIGGSPSGPTDWDLPGNWEGGVPGTASHAIIPAGADYYPVLPSDALPDGTLLGGRIVNTIEIQDGGTVNATTGSPTFTITGAATSWVNHGTFNAGTSTIVFTNAAAFIDDVTYFYNVTVTDGAKLILGTNNYMGISGALSLSTTGVLDSWSNSNTIEYNGGAQTVILPVVPELQPNYHNLVLSGSGTKTMPASAMYLHGEFIMSGTASATAGGAFTIHGTHSNIRLGSGTTFIAGSYTHSLFGDLENNGATFTTTGSTFSFNGTAAQTIGGSASSTFNNLTLDNTAGASLSINETINGALVFTNGKITLGANDLLLGSSATITGSGSSTYVVTDGAGALRQRVTNNATDVTFPVGLASAYLPVAVRLTEGSTADDIKARVSDLLYTAYNGDDVPTGSPIASRVVPITWYLKESEAGGSIATVTVQWNASDEASNFARNWCDVAHYTGGSWVYMPGSAASGANPYTQTISGTTSFSPFGVFGQNITNSFSGTTFCAGSALSVAYTASGGTWNSGNIFTAQLSDKDGSFTSPTSMGTNTSQSSGSISATIPSNTINGTAYRIRIISDNPSGDGDDNGTNLTINQLRSISGIFRYYNVENTTLANGITAKLYQDGSQVGSDYNVTSGSYSFTSLCPGTYEVRATSTLETEGSVNTTDAGQVNYWGAHPYLIEKVRFYAGDVTGEPFFINGTDAESIQSHFVNGTAFDRPDWTFWKSGETIGSNTSPEEIYPTITVPNSADVEANIYGLCTGDFNRSFVPGDVKSANATLLLTDGTRIKAESNQKTDLTLRMADKAWIGAISLVLNFPANLVSIKNVVVHAEVGQFDWAVSGNELRIGWNSQVPVLIPADGKLVTITVQTTDAFISGSNARLTLVSTPLNELADANYEVIGGAVLKADFLSASPTGMDEQPGNLELGLSNYPNPFTNSTTIGYALPFEGLVTLEVRTILGTKVTSLVHQEELAGYHTFEFKPVGIPPGIYLVNLWLAGNAYTLSRSIKMVINR